MKITICGSVKFRKEMVEARDKLRWLQNYFVAKF